MSSPLGTFALAPWGQPEFFEQAFYQVFEEHFRPWWNDESMYEDSEKAYIRKNGPLCHAAPACTEDVGAVFDEFGQFLMQRCNLPSGSIRSHRKRIASPNPYPERELDYSLRLTPPTLLDGRLQPGGIVAAGESEWGKYGNFPENYRLVREDFLKLVAATSPLKVLIYGCHYPPHYHRSDIPSLLDLFRGELFRGGKYKRGEVWLFVGISWGPGRWHPQVHVIRRRSGQLQLDRTEWLRS